MDYETLTPDQQKKVREYFEALGIDTRSVLVEGLSAYPLSAYSNRWVLKYNEIVLDAQGWKQFAPGPTNEILTRPNLRIVYKEPPWLTHPA